MKELKTIRELNRFLYRFRELQKISRQLRRLSECSCNYGLTDRQEKREENLINKAQEITKEFNLKIFHQGDPRGCALYLVSEEEFNKGSNCDYLNGIAVY